MNKLIVLAMMLTIAAPAFAASTVQRDAPIVRFYDARGNVTGSASTYGNITKFYGPDGWLVGTGKRYAN